MLAVRIGSAAARALAEALPDLERRQVSAAAPNQATGGLQHHHAPAEQAPDLAMPEEPPNQVLGRTGNPADICNGEAGEIRRAIWQPDAVTPAKAPPLAHSEWSQMATPPAQVCVQRVHTP